MFLWQNVKKLFLIENLKFRVFTKEKPIKKNVKFTKMFLIKLMQKKKKNQKKKPMVFDMKQNRLWKLVL